MHTPSAVTSAPSACTFRQKEHSFASAFEPHEKSSCRPAGAAPPLDEATATAETLNSPDEALTDIEAAQLVVQLARLQARNEQVDTL